MAEIRMAAPGDAAVLLEIYAPYVENTAVTFEYTVPSEEEFAERIEKILEFYPYLVYEDNGKILGYAYASSFKARAAYIWSAEVTVYVREDAHGCGIGRALYTRLEELLKKQGITNLNACITHPNPDSESFHRAMGYSPAAHFTECAYKLGQWWDMVWLEKHIGRHENPPRSVVGCKWD